MELSVVVTHYRDVDLLRQCLTALKADLQNISNEIIVILSEHKAETLSRFTKEFPAVKFLPFEKNLYFVGSVNRGLEQAKGESILLINDDVIVSKGSINILIDFLKNNPEVGLVGPKILYPDGNNQPSCFRFYSPMAVVCRRTILGKLRICEKILNSFLYQDKNLNQENGVEVEWMLNGAGVLMKKEYLEKVGMLDERFKHYFSDVDWCRRFWQSGFKVVYLANVSFYHHHAKSSASRGIISVLTNKMTRMHVWDGMKYFWKWGLKATPIHGLHPDDTD